MLLMLMRLLLLPMLLIEIVIMLVPWETPFRLWSFQAVPVAGRGCSRQDFSSSVPEAVEVAAGPRGDGCPNGCPQGMSSDLKVSALIFSACSSPEGRDEIP